MLQNSWSIKLSEPPTHSTLALLPDPSIVFQGTSNQLLVFTNNKTDTLPIRKDVLSLATINQVHILILTRYSLSCFDFLSNQEKFTIQFQNAQKMEIIDDRIYVVSGSSLYCYDLHGEEDYVNHISANISALAKVHTDKNDGEIVIATNDMAMARYIGLNISFDYSKIVGTASTLCWVGKGVLVGTKEGSIAYYQSKKSKWKAKSSHAVLKILKFSQSMNGKTQLFQGSNISSRNERIFVVRQNGAIQLRDWENGSTLSKIKCGQQIRSAFIADFRNQGYSQILAILASGIIRAYNFIQSVDEADTKVVNKKNIVGSEAINQNQQIDNLIKIKTELNFEISQLKAVLSNDEEKQIHEDEVLSENFKMKAVLQYREGLTLIISCTSGYISGLTFEQPIMPVLVEKTTQLEYKFRNSNESAGQIVCEVLVHSSASSLKYLVKTINIFLPKFWKWGLYPNVNKQIQGRLRFKMVQRNARYIKWMKQCFFMNLSQKDQENLESLSVMKVRFYNWYQQEEMELIFSQKQGLVEIHCDCLKTLGDIVQDLVNYVGLKDLNTELHFPQQKEKIKQLLASVERLSQAKVSISSDMAESINVIKFLLVKAESARQVSSMNSLRKTYAEVMEQNRSLVVEIDKKNMNTKTLSEAMKSVGNFINQIANIRYGKSKNLVITKCRQAIKKKNFPVIIEIMANGVEPASDQ